MPTEREARPAAELGEMTSRLADLASRLATLLARETALVRAMKVKEIGTLQAEKVSLSAQYQTAFKALTSAQPAAALPEVIREQLARSGQRLAEAVVENELALRVGQVAAERLIGSIVAAVKKQKKHSLSYAPQPRTPRHTFMTAAAVDRRM